MHFIYCPYCGSKLNKREIGDEGLIPYCDNCRIPLWDMFTTCIIAAVVNEYDEIALLRQDYVSTTNEVCVAGVMKPGESAEEAAVREIREETGLEALSLEYIGSYPYEKKEMLMIGYKVTVKKAEIITSDEVDSAEWVKLSDALGRLREGGIAWQLVKSIQNSCP